MSEVVLNAQTREGIGKKYTRKLRSESKIPGIYYAHDQKNINLEFDQRQLQQFLSSNTGLFDLSVDKKKAKKCILKEVQIDPVSMKLLHVDIMGVQLKEKIYVSIPIKIVGEAKGAKEQGGVLNQALHEIEISCLPLDLPEYVEIDVTNLDVGDTIHVSEIKIDNVEIITDPEVQVAGVSLPRATVQAEAVTPEEEALAEEKEEEDKSEE